MMRNVENSYCNIWNRYHFYYYLPSWNDFLLLKSLTTSRNRLNCKIFKKMLLLRTNKWLKGKKLYNDKITFPSNM